MSDLKIIFVGVCHAIIQNAMIGSLDDISELLDESVIEEFKLLLKQNKFIEVNSNPQYINCLIKEKFFHYFQEADAIPYID